MSCRLRSSTISAACNRSAVITPAKWPATARIATTVELQLNTSAHIEPFGKPHDVGLQFYTFYDWGQGWQNQSLSFSTHVSSVGIGVRSALTQFLEFDMEGVTRLNRQPASSSAAVAPLDAQAFYWRVLVRF